MTMTTIETTSMATHAGGSAMNPMQAQTRVAEYLRIHPGHAFCDDCLAGKLGIGLAAMRLARAALASARDLDRETWFCSACMSMKDVLHVAWLGSRP